MVISESLASGEIFTGLNCQVPPSDIGKLQIIPARHGREDGSAALYCVG